MPKQSPTSKPERSGANIRITFRSTISYLRHYIFRRDWLLALLFALIALQTISQVASFLLLAGSLRGMITGGTLSFSGFSIPGLSTPIIGLTAGIVLLGLSVVFRVAALTTSIRAGANFGTEVVFRLQKVWDTLTIKQRRYVFQLGRLATFLSRLVVNSLAPTAVFFAGLIFLAFIDIFVAGIVLLVGALALFAFVPSNLLDAKSKEGTFNPDISANELGDQRSQVAKTLRARLAQYRARQLIGSVNLFVFFLAIATLPLFVDLAWAVEHYAEAIVLILLIGRSSILSLSSIAIMLRMIGVNADGVTDMVAILDHGTIPSPGSITTEDDEDTE